MRRALCAVMSLALLLSGCRGRTDKDRARDDLSRIRTMYLEMTACSGHIDMRADYGQRVYDYGADLAWEKGGETVLTLTEPELVAGTVVRLHDGETTLEYDGIILETGPLIPSGLSPIDVIPALIGYAVEGFAAECAYVTEGSVERLAVWYRDPDHTPGDGTEAQLWFDLSTGAMLRAELDQDGRTVLTCTFSDFSMTGPRT